MVIELYHIMGKMLRISFEASGMEKSKKGLKIGYDIYGWGWGVWIFLGSLANWLGFNDSGDVFSYWETKKIIFLISS